MRDYSSPGNLERRTVQGQKSFIKKQPKGEEKADVRKFSQRMRFRILLGRSRDLFLSRQGCVQKGCGVLGGKERTRSKKWRQILERT